ncbi:hypothetical protein [Streptomyces sp. MJP52]|uniref:hypothetical protein n=1 Tax=Streptomyces sp. MJP52 TaxID=2940555 RepID=UPI002473B205|nr:hypothetical protein [Streptomyces sp. MJP52]MDH6223560.1 hypothetical protein [Streptomyces sp. MJP52]
MSHTAAPRNALRATVASALIVLLAAAGAQTGWAAGTTGPGTAVVATAGTTAGGDTTTDEGDTGATTGGTGSTGGTGTGSTGGTGGTTDNNPWD